MSILKIAKIGHPVLLKKTNEIKEIGTDNIKLIINNMSETMLDADGVGLAAPQVYLSKRLFIYRNPDQEEDEKNIKISVLINPKIEKINNETDDAWEGCLSIPGMLGLVRRFSKINFSGFDLDGNEIKNSAEGLHARIIQHEFDHLNGVLYTSRLVHKDAFGFSNEIEKYWKQNNEQK